MRQAIGCVGLLIFLVGFFNVVVFFAISISEGGDALNGKIEGGKYYLAQHFQYTEVTEAVWRRSRRHAISVLVTTPLGIIGGALAYWAFPQLWKENWKEKETGRKKGHSTFLTDSADEK